MGPAGDSESSPQIDRGSSVVRFHNAFNPPQVGRRGLERVMVLRLKFSLVLVTWLLLPLLMVWSADPQAAIPQEYELPGPPAAGPGRIPHHQDVDSLMKISLRAGENPAAAAEQLQDWLETRHGSLIFPLRTISIGSRGTIRIGRASRQLERFARSLPDGFLDVALKRLGPIAIDGAHPLVWQPDRGTEANRALQEALERADRSAAWALLQRPGIREGIDPNWLRWLEGTPPLEGPWRRSDGPLIQPPVQSAGSRVEGSLAIPMPETGPEATAHRKAQVWSRRHPLSDLFPLLGQRTALFGNGHRVVAIDLDEPTREAWQWQVPRPDESPGRTQLPFISVPEIPVSSGDRCVFLLRTPRQYQQPSTNIILESGPWKDRGWLEAVVLEIPDPQKPPISSWVAPIASEGFSACPVPLIEGDRLWLLATRGWSTLETWVFAFDLAHGKELWRRQLEVRELEAHALNDLRDKILSASLARSGDDLLVSRSGGAIECLSASSGAHRATLHQPRWRFEELPSLSDIRWGNQRFLAYPGLRPRSNSPIQVPEDESSPWLLLPPDGRMLIALEKDSWHIRWSHPVGRQTSLLGIVDGIAWLFDGNIEVGQRTIHLTGLDPRNGEVVAGPWAISLTAKSVAEKTDPTTLQAPLLRGQPRIFSGRIWIPSAAGIDVYSLRDGSSLAILPWPEGSKGGTPLPLEGGELLIARRADQSMPSSSVIELVRPIPQPDGASEEAKEER